MKAKKFYNKNTINSKTRNKKKSTLENKNLTSLWDKWLENMEQVVKSKYMIQRINIGFKSNLILRI